MQTQKPTVDEPKGWDIVTGKPQQLFFANVTCLLIYRRRIWKCCSHMR